MMVDLCLDSLEGVGWLTIDNQQGEGEGISKRLFRFQDCSKLMELWHLRKLQCKTVEPGWCGGLKLFRKSTGTWYIYACTYIIYKQIHIYIYIHTDIHYIHTHMLLYISHALRMSLGLELDLQLFRKRAVLKTDPLCSNIARRAGMQPVFFIQGRLSPTLMKHGRWMKAFRFWAEQNSGASLTYLSWTWAELFWG